MISYIIVGIVFPVSGLIVVSFPLSSASLSLLPWPKPAVWPSVPGDSSVEVLEKEKVL